MQANDPVRLGMTVISGLAAWELGQVLATYLIIGFYGDHFHVVFTPGGGFDQLDTLGVLLIRLVISTLVAVPVLLLLLLGKFLWRGRAR